jgi:formylglycine-generating enzyme required for sulfatase activity
MAWVAAALVVAFVAAFAARLAREGAQCGDGFVAEGARCVAPRGACPSPFVRSSAGCAAPDARVRIDPSKLAVGPSDWEAEGRVAARTLETAAFYIDAFEVTEDAWNGTRSEDGSRAASGMTRVEAAAFCASRGGRLPTEDEWIAAATAPRAAVPRYPWGETGAVCRRAAWGLSEGPCTRGATGPDTVGAHASGDTPLGLHDMAGNVAEWVDDADADVARGGSWRSTLATDLRVWERRELPKGARDASVGVRCAHDAPR